MYWLCGHNFYFIFFIFFSLFFSFTLEETNAFSVYVETERLHWDILEAVFLATCM